MESYDYVLAGGGLAGLSLAHAIVDGPAPDGRILIVDPEQKGENDRTWSFWTNRQESFESIISREWSQIEFASHSWTRTIELGDYRYCMVRGGDFYEYALDRLEKAPGVDFMRDTVDHIEADEAGVVVTTGAGSVRGRYAFDSRFDPAEYSRREGPHHYLKQHFLGWVIESEQDVFQADCATMFDFRTPQCGEMRFVYVLPLSEKKALVEFTLFTSDLLSDEEYTAGLETYVAEVLGLESYRIVEREKGVIPMTDEPVNRVPNPRTLAIGTRGGMVKASTGYAFLRTQRDAAAIASSLERTGTPFDIPKPPAWNAALDSTMLQVMFRRGEITERTFTQLYQRNPIDRLFRFLDEESSFPETLALMTTVPIGPFLRAFIRTQFLRRV